MKLTVCFVLLLIVAAGVRAAEQAVPAVVTVPSEIKRVIVIRLKYDTDLLKGLEEAVKREKIKNGVFLSGAGSLTSYHVHSVSNTTFPSTQVYSKATGPYDLLTVTGYVLSGRVHAHITLVDDKKAFGGHLHEGTKVFTFAIITVGLLDDKPDLTRFDDSKWQ